MSSGQHEGSVEDVKFLLDIGQREVAKEHIEQILEEEGVEVDEEPITPEGYLGHIRKAAEEPWDLPRKSVERLIEYEWKAHNGEVKTSKNIIINDIRTKTLYRGISARMGDILRENNVERMAVPELLDEMKKAYQDFETAVEAAYHKPVWAWDDEEKEWIEDNYDIRTELNVEQMDNRLGRLYRHLDSYGENRWGDTDN